MEMYTDRVVGNRSDDAGGGGGGVARRERVDQSVDELGRSRSEDDELAVGDGVAHHLMEDADVLLELDGDVVFAVGGVTHAMPP